MVATTTRVVILLPLLLFMYSMQQAQGADFPISAFNTPDDELLLVSHV